MAASRAHDKKTSSFYCLCKFPPGWTGERAHAVPHCGSHADIAMMAPHAVNWQVKETLGSRLKSPRADFKKLAKVIFDGGYRGFMPIETLAMGRKDYNRAAEV